MYEAFVTAVTDRGGILLRIPPGHDNELHRFMTCYGVGIIYQDRGGGVVLSKEARKAYDHVQTPGLGPLTPRKRKKTRQQKLQDYVARPFEIAALKNRDGGGCFFCLRPLGDDITLEHLVATSKGGPDVLENKFLAHARCNNDARDISAVHKIKIREAALRKRWQAQNDAEKESA